MHRGSDELFGRDRHRQMPLYARALRPVKRRATARSKTGLIKIALSILSYQLIELPAADEPIRSGNRGGHPVLRVLH